jgi:hypothetical protein
LFSPCETDHSFILIQLHSSFSVLVCSLNDNVHRQENLTNIFWKVIMSKKTKQNKKQALLEKRERAMVEGILEGSPDGIAVVVVRLDCGCRKMAAVSKEGEPASKIIMYRDNAESVCSKCKDDQGAFMRILEQFIFWKEPEPTQDEKDKISVKVMGSTQASVH